MLSIQNSLTGEGAPKILAPGTYTKKERYKKEKIYPKNL